MVDFPGGFPLLVISLRRIDLHCVNSFLSVEIDAVDSPAVGLHDLGEGWVQFLGGTDVELLAIVFSLLLRRQEEMR